MSQPYIDFAYVKSNASFERVIAGYNLKLPGTGSQRSLLCPFHPERRPSCKVDLDRGLFHCFGCEASGNVIEFVARMEGQPDDLRAACVKIAELCGIATAPPRAAGTKRMSRSSRQRRIAGAWLEPEHSPEPLGRKKIACTDASRRFSPANDADAAPAAVNPPLPFALKLDPNHPYLAERGLSRESIAEFGLGFCARGSMAGRICIPIHDESGELIAYAGRWPAEEPPDGIERYLLPKQFQKARVLFNLHRVADAEHVILVEGYWSAIRLHRLAMPVVALMGWSVSSEQLALLRERGTRFVTVLWDGDEAGCRARERALPHVTDAFFVRAPVLPPGYKPDTIPEALLRDLATRP